MVLSCSCVVFFFFKQKTAYEMRISDWSSDVCSSDLVRGFSTPTGRIEFYSEALQRLGQPPVPDAGPKRPRNPEFPLILTQGKFGHFCHSQHRQIAARSEEHTSELQSLMRNSNAVF